MPNEEDKLTGELPGKRVAYRKKYSGSPYLNSMISERAKAATVKVLQTA